MAPETRSRGVPPPNRVYHSTPVLQQAQFPSRRRAVRTYGDRREQSREPTPASTARDPRQKTLTQIDWVSSSSLSEAATVGLSDSEEDEFAAGNKENEGPGNEEPVSSGKRKKQSGLNAGAENRGKRRRTLGDQTESTTGKMRDESRRKTLGDTPTSSKYHTQTLTQLLGKEELALIKDSEDEDDDGFDDWLHDPASPSPLSRRPQRDESPSKPSRSAATEDVPRRDTSRQSSVVPQTPARRNIRFEIPSSSQQSTPMTGRMLDRYGPPDQEKPSPSVKGGKQVLKQITELPGKPTGTSRKMVIEDSFATESWGSGGGTSPVKGTPLKDITEEVTGEGNLNRESSSVTEFMSTPTKPRRHKSAELGEETPRKVSSGDSPSKTPTPKKVSIGGLFEIPDSDEDDGDFSEEEHGDDHPGQDDAGTEQDADDWAGEQASLAPKGDVQTENEPPGEGDYGYRAGPETQYAMDELVSSVDHLSGQRTRQSSTGPPASTTAQPQPEQHNPPTAVEPVSSPKLPPPKSSHQGPPDSSTPRPKPSKPLRRPLRHLPPSSQTQPLESQRVPLATIQSFGHPTNRTDIFLPLLTSTIDPLVSGHQINLSLPFKIPAQVARFWLFDGGLLRYAACVEPGEEEDGGGRSWRYHVSQLYELNNPLDMADMKEEGWLDDDDLRHSYIYLPPVGVSQLLANLRHALFSEDGDGPDEEEESQQQLPVDVKSEPHKRSTPNPGSSFSISQQLEAQIHSDMATHPQAPQHPPGDEAPPDDAILVPSTPLKERRGARQTPRPPIRPSQATTASQASTPEKLPHQPPSSRTPRRPAPAPNPPPPQSSSSGLTFQDHGSSSTPFLLPCSNPGASLRSSQLLTKSQMLPDSLLRDDPRMPPEIRDSDEEQG